MMATKKKVAKRKKVGKKVGTTKLPKTINFHYLKGPDFRSLHVDGAIGGLTTKGFLHVALFTERTAIPKQTTVKLSPDGELGDEIMTKRESLSGVIRQMEVDLIMNEDAAKDLRTWLDVKLEEFEERRQLLATLTTKRDKKSH